jgi:hypothetical protein
VTPDPILAAIARHRDAYQEAIKDDAAPMLWKTVDDAAEHLLEVMPTTVAGLMALCDFASELEGRHGPNIWPDARAGASWTARCFGHIEAALMRLHATGEQEKQARKVARRARRH